MSQFFSLDDDDDAAAGPSDHGSVVRGSLASPSISSRSNSIHRGNASSSSQNPIYALLQGETGELKGTGNGSISKDDYRDLRQNGSTRREEVPIRRLQTAWISERGCPELLDWRGDAVDDVCSQIEEQMTIVESLAADASTAEEEHVRLGLVEIDVERARWLLKSYLRCRLAKIEKHAAYLKQDAKSRAKMSDLEKGYCVKYAEMQSDHFHTSVLDFLPSNLRSLEDKAESGSNGRGDMVMQPDLDCPVFIRCLQDCGQYQFKGHDDLVAFVRGSIHFVRYSTVRTLIESGRVEVL